MYPLHFTTIRVYTLCSLLFYNWIIKYIGVCTSAQLPLSPLLLRHHAYSVCPSARTIHILFLSSSLYLLPLGRFSSRIDDESYQIRLMPSTHLLHFSLFNFFFPPHRCFDTTHFNSIFPITDLGIIGNAIWLLFNSKIPEIRLSLPKALPEKNTCGKTSCWHRRPPMKPSARVSKTPLCGRTRMWRGNLLDLTLFLVYFRHPLSIVVVVPEDPLLLSNNTCIHEIMNLFPIWKNYTKKKRFNTSTNLPVMSSRKLQRDCLFFYHSDWYWTVFTCELHSKFEEWPTSTLTSPSFQGTRKVWLRVAFRVVL